MTPRLWRPIYSHRVLVKVFPLIVTGLSPRFRFYPIRSQISAILLDLLAAVHCFEDPPANRDIPRGDGFCLCIRKSKLGKEYGDDVLAV